MWIPTCAALLSAAARAEPPDPDLPADSPVVTPAPAPAPPPRPLLDEPAPAVEAEVLDLQGRAVRRWDEIDARAVVTARRALMLHVAFTSVSTVGLAMLGNDKFGDEHVRVPGAVLVAVGATGATISAPVMLGAVARSGRAMRERGVFAGNGLTALGWVLYGAGTPLVSVFTVAPPTYPIWSVAVAGVGAAAAAHNARVRDEADLPDVGVPWRLTVLPSANGVTLAGSF